MSGAPPENDLSPLVRLQYEAIGRLRRENAALQAKCDAFESHAVRLQGEVDHLTNVIRELRNRACLPS